VNESQIRFEDYLRGSDAESGGISGSLLMIMILLFIGTAIGWAAMTEIDEVTRGQGKVVPSRHLQVVQSYEGGVIREIRARQGEQVESGDVLLVLEGGMLEGGFLEVRQQFLALQAAVERLESEIHDQPLRFSAAVETDVPRIVAAERELFEGRRNEIASELRVLDRQLAQRREELAEARIHLRTARSGIELAESELAIVRPLVERGIEPELTLLQLRRSINDLQGERDRSERTVARLDQAIDEIEDRRVAMRDGFRARALAERSGTLARLSEIEQSLPARAEQVARTQIRAPVAGTINRVHVTTVGGVVSPGEPLVEIVPTDDFLRIEAHIRPGDIGFIYPGQRVKIKLTAYDFARYGGLDGVLDFIGADAVQLPEFEEPMFPIQVSTDGSLLDADGLPLGIIPGMIAEVDILGSKKTVLDYLVEPVVKVKQRAFRD
jgi:adhesin transport system membrane fusion protein